MEQVRQPSPNRGGCAADSGDLIVTKEAIVEWFLFLFPFLIVALLAVRVGRQRRVDRDDMRQAQLMHTAAEAKCDDLGGAAI